MLDQSPSIVYCDMTNDGGGWTVWIRRLKAGVNFNLTWASYKTGFGGNILKGEEFNYFVF